MSEKEDLNLTLPIILIGVLAIGLFLYFSSSDVEEVIEETVVVQEQQAAAYFVAPNVVKKGERAMFSWKADVSNEAVCVGKIDGGGSDGGWSGVKNLKGEQEVGPIEGSTAYFLDCTDGEKMIRDVELIQVIE